jgi:hypothetical protein
MIRSFGKSIEAVVRKVRPHVLPSYRRAFSALLARGMSERREGEFVVCCDFANQAIDHAGGRYYFGLVRDLIDAGYFPVFTARRGTLSTFGTSSLKSLLLTERLGVVRSFSEISKPFYLITDDVSASPEGAEKIVLVDYEWRVCQAADELAFQFFVHPWVAKERAPETHEARPSRLFFGGNTAEEKYDKDVIRDVYGMLSRREMLEVATQSISSDHTFKPNDAAEWLSSTDCHPFVFCETQRCKIPPSRWLEALAKADFFLACPGVGMPLCHNVIEAMAAGSVPILQYCEYLSPPLKHGINCLAFHDERSLELVLNSIFSMTEDHIQRLRAGVRAYHEANLAPGRFAHRLFSSPQKNRVMLLNEYRVPR